MLQPTLLVHGRDDQVIPLEVSIRALRALVRGRDDLVATRVQLANQLRSLLQSFWPGAAEVFADVDSPIGLAFILRYPTPESASRLGPKRMAAFCAQHAYSARFVFSTVSCCINVLSLHFGVVASIKDLTTGRMRGR